MSFSGTVGFTNQTREWVLGMELTHDIILDDRNQTHPNFHQNQLSHKLVGKETGDSMVLYMLELNALACYCGTSAINHTLFLYFAFLLHANPFPLDN